MIDRETEVGETRCSGARRCRQFADALEAEDAEVRTSPWADEGLQPAG